MTIFHFTLSRPKTSFPTRSLSLSYNEKQIHTLSIKHGLLTRSVGYIWVRSDYIDRGCVCFERSIENMNILLTTTQRGALAFL